jgi:hypothetical protein
MEVVEALQLHVLEVVAGSGLIPLSVVTDVLCHSHSFSISFRDTLAETKGSQPFMCVTLK